MRNCELAERNKIRAFRAGAQILIAAEGVLPTPGFDVDIKARPERIFPQQFNLLRCPKPGFFPQVLSPFKYAEIIPFPEEPEQVTVHHSEGTDKVDIEELGAALAPLDQAVAATNGDTDVATGFSANLSFDEAFAAALANLPEAQPPFPDALARVEVQQIGGLFGGIAGFRHMFVQVSRSFD
jgi:hypothetical protein